MRLMPSLALMSAVLLCGCAQPTVAARSVSEIERGDYARVFDAAVVVLREQGFVVAQQDYRFGTVGAQPQPSPVAIEFWRPGNLTVHQALGSTINHQRRVVTVFLEPVEPPIAAADPPQPSNDVTPGYDNYLLRVEVVVEQLQSPINHLTGSTAGYRVIGRMRQSPAELQDRGISGAYWQPVARDPQVEQRLLERILAHSAQIDTPRIEPLEPPLIDVTRPPPLDGLD